MRASAGTALAVLSLLALAFSGCSDSGRLGGGPDGPGPGGDGEGPGPDGLGAGTSIVPFEGVEQAIATTLGFEGTVPFMDTCRLVVGCVEHTHDVSGDVPQGAVARVTLDLAYDSQHPVFHVETYLTGDFYFFERTDPVGEAGKWSVSYLLVHGGDLQAAVIAGGPTANQADVDYLLRVTVEASNTTVPASVPVAVSLGKNDTVAMRNLVGQPTPFTLFTPDDLPIEVQNGLYTVPLDSPAGEYVLLPKGPATVWAQDEKARLRVVGVRYEEASAAFANGATVTVSGQGHPVEAGMFFHGPETGTMTATPMTFTLTSPAGTELLRESFCEPFCSGGFSQWWVTDFGSADLQPGTYTVTAEGEVEHEVTFGAFLGYLDRQAYA